MNDYKIYLPISDFSNFACYSVNDKDTIRAYKTMPQQNSSSDYVDFYINSHYLTKTGNQTWGNYYTNLPICLNTSQLTNAYFYRNDISDICITYCSIFFITICVVGFVIKCFFKGLR